MNERQRGIWLAGAGFGVLFVLLNLVNLVFLEGDTARDLVAIALGVIMTVLAHARAHGWKGLRV